MTEEKTITLKKSDLWKYSTFILIAVVVVLGIVMFNGNSSGNAVVNNGNSGSTGGAVDLSVFLNNPDLYPSLGPENADNVIIEFSDFQCPYCGMASGLPSWIGQYASQYPDLVDSAGKIQDLAANGEVRFVYVPMSFLGQESVDAAEAAYCANEQGLFWKMHDALFTAQSLSENGGTFSVANLKTIAASIDGLNTAEFNDCLDNGKYSSTVQTVSRQASTAASGTPTFYVNGEKMSASWSAISAAIA